MTTNYFARYIGLPYGENLYQIKRGNNGISQDVANRIVSKFPEISKGWILTGEGSMLNSEKMQSAQIPFYEEDCETVLPNIEKMHPVYNMFIPDLRDCDLAVTYEKNTKNGKTVEKTVLFLKKTDIEEIISGKEYIVVCKNSIFLRKFRLSDGGRTIKTAGKTNEQTINTCDADAVYRVEGRLTIKK